MVTTRLPNWPRGRKYPADQQAVFYDRRPSLNTLLGITKAKKRLKKELVTRDEIEGLMADLLCVDAPPAGQTALTSWVKEHAGTLGHRVAIDSVPDRN
ncbi:MAG: hypothetical protein ABR915_02680 [Thermoguttaceae bacterium]